MPVNEEDRRKRNSDADKVGEALECVLSGFENVSKGSVLIAACGLFVGLCMHYKITPAQAIEMVKAGFIETPHA